MFSFINYNQAKSKYSFANPFLSSRAPWFHGFGRMIPVENPPNPRPTLQALAQLGSEKGWKLSNQKSHLRSGPLQKGPLLCTIKKYTPVKHGKTNKLTRSQEKWTRIEDMYLFPIEKQEDIPLLCVIMGM